jgi:hypothetical protein
MNTREVSRRQLLNSIGSAAGAILLAGGGDARGGSPQPVSSRANNWKYVTLIPATVAAEAYRLMPQGGCMYGLFASVMSAMAQIQGEPYLNFRRFSCCSNSEV